mgnify:FL=1
MIISCITILLFIAALAGLMLYPKTECRLNGFKMLITGTMLLLFFLAFTALLYSKTGLGVKLATACISLLIVNVFVWPVLIRKKKIQKMFWRISDAACLLLLGAFVVCITIHVFTPQLRLQYYNADAASHFLYANLIVHTERISSLTYFSAYIDAFFIQIFSPVLTPIRYYKAYIMADVFMHLLEIWMFYFLVLSVSEKKAVRILAPVLALGYFWGYPAYSFMEGHFVYWSNGVLIFIFILYVLILMEKGGISFRYTVPMLLLGLYANTCCNKLFVPVNTFSVAVVLAVLVLKKYGSRIDKKKLRLFLLAAVLLLIAAAGIYLYIWRGTFATLLDDLRVPGGIYSSMYAEFILFVPVWIYACYYVVKERRQKQTIVVTAFCTLIVTAAMLTGLLLGYMALYYYYKIYYNIWLCCWLLAVVALDIMIEKKQGLWFVSYASMAVLMCWIALSGYEDKMAEKHEDYQEWNATKQICSLYHYNRENMLADYSTHRISDKVLDAFRYARDEMSDTDVRIVTSNWTLQAWHDALDLVHQGGFRFFRYELPDLLKDLDDFGVKAIVIEKSDPQYLAYEDYFSGCREVYGNSEIAILEPSGERWFEVPESIADQAEEKIELFDYARDNLSDQAIPLLADKSAYYDYMMYYMEVQNPDIWFYPWKQITEEEQEGLSEEELTELIAEQNLEALRKAGTEYIIVEYGDAFSERIRNYLDQEEIIYENEAGKIIRLTSEENKWDQ